MKEKQGMPGAKARWDKRFKAIEVLRSKYSKKQLDGMLRWPSGALIELAKWVNK